MTDMGFSWFPNFGEIRRLQVPSFTSLQLFSTFQSIPENVLSVASNFVSSGVPTRATENEHISTISVAITRDSAMTNSRLAHTEIRHPANHRPRDLQPPLLHTVSENNNGDVKMPPLPLVKVKKVLLGPIRNEKWTEMLTTSFESHSHLFRLGDSDDLTRKSFRVLARFSLFSRTKKKLDKYNLFTRLWLNHRELNLTLTGLNPICDITEYMQNVNHLSIMWKRSEIGKDREVRFTIQLVEILSESEIKRNLMLKSPISKSVTIKKIHGVICRSVEDGVMEANDFMKISLKCPLSKFAMKIPCRATTCTHFTCFDGPSFLKMSQIRATWKCPICNSNINYEDICVDRFFLATVKALVGKLTDGDIDCVWVNSSGQLKYPRLNKVQKASTTTKTNKAPSGIIFKREQLSDNESAKSIPRRPPKKSVEIVYESGSKRQKLN